MIIMQHAACNTQTHEMQRRSSFGFMRRHQQTSRQSVPASKASLRAKHPRGLACHTTRTACVPNRHHDTSQKICGRSRLRRYAAKLRRLSARLRIGLAQRSGAQVLPIMMVNSPLFACFKGLRTKLWRNVRHTALRSNAALS
jgi:hypothetical protein